ncbi:MAG: energy-coupling factor ABC transporter ATP-binding protein [Spirochaetaceae bacterium]|nr:energy-coupling factor ABC transporter ATP-binding protein [Spirochaetaceae bacterium]
MTEPPLLSLRNISKSFPAGEGQRRVLDGVNLDVYPGECLIIAGPNGSGKTLLMKIAAGLSDPSEGEVLYRGIPPRAAELYAGLGLVFQDADAQIIGETVREDAAFGPRNLGLSRQEAVKAAEEALETAGLAGKFDFPSRRLSGGEKRRLAVAGILAMGCRAMIFDEPFANLDWPGVKSVLRIMGDLKSRGHTLIILTHELEKVLALADRLVILHRGRIRENGSPPEVLARLCEDYGVRNPLRSVTRVEDCSWLA